jgi:hypothetical protein
MHPDRGTIPRARVILALIYFSRENKNGTDRWLKPERLTPKVRRFDNVDHLFLAAYIDKTLSIHKRLKRLVRGAIYR